MGVDGEGRGEGMGRGEEGGVNLCGQGLKQVRRSKSSFVGSGKRAKGFWGGAGSNVLFFPQPHSPNHHTFVVGRGSHKNLGSIIVTWSVYYIEQ